jgi:hypothetical protein
MVSRSFSAWFYEILSIIFAGSSLQALSLPWTLNTAGAAASAL